MIQLPAAVIPLLPWVIIFSQDVGDPEKGFVVGKVGHTARRESYALETGLLATHKEGSGPALTRISLETICYDSARHTIPGLRLVGELQSRGGGTFTPRLRR